MSKKTGYLQKGEQSCQYLSLARETRLTSDLQNCELIIVPYFKPWMKSVKMGYGRDGKLIH